MPGLGAGEVACPIFQKKETKVKCELVALTITPWRRKESMALFQ
jgi:hypothetical protein